MNDVTLSTVTVDDEAAACPVGRVELTPRSRVGRRAGVLAGLPLTASATAGFLTLPTVVTFDPA
jgi:hypothetical protein